MWAALGYSGITSDAGDADGGRGSSRPWERSAFNVSHVLTRYYNQHESERDPHTVYYAPDEDATSYTTR
ncbi:unnamed protein product [Colias eurytheme]|nr:unnamed protein product [Colias eurytheme]